MKVTPAYIKNNVTNALEEDIGSGDVTAKLIPDNSQSYATIITRVPATICGIDWFNEVFMQLDPKIKINWKLKEGDSAQANQQICTLNGPTQALLTGERSALNFLQTLSATATQASIYADAIKGTQAKLLDTRKTIPGLRLAQKYAARCGGCHNHRIGLFDAVLIKENHIHACGGISNAIELARKNNPNFLIEIEVENMQELKTALNAQADRIMLDNFDLDLLKEAVNITAHKTKLEASGNITLKNIRAIAETGIDYISIGAITKNIIAIDLSMRFSTLNQYG